MQSAEFGIEFKPVPGIDIGVLGGDAIVCIDCVRQADRAFDKDPDTDWTRRMAPTDRWR